MLLNLDWKHDKKIIIPVTVILSLIAISAWVYVFIALTM